MLMNIIMKTKLISYICLDYMLKHYEPQSCSYSCFCLERKSNLVQQQRSFCKYTKLQVPNRKWGALLFWHCFL